MIAQIEQDHETRALLENVLEDELATVRWFHAVAKGGARRRRRRERPRRHAPV